MTAQRDVQFVAAQKDIRIISSNGVTEPDRQELSKSQGDQAVWSSGTGQNFTVVFTNTSPFNSHTFPVNPGAPTPSGQIRPDAAEGSYKYEVRGPGGNTDPTIIIKN